MERKKVRNIAIFFLTVFVFFGYFFMFLPFQRIKAKADVLIRSSKELKKVFSQNDIDLLKSKMNDFSKTYEEFEKESQAIFWASFIPYISDYKNGVEAGKFLIKAGNEAVAAITPYADLIGFKKGSTSFIERSSEDRLQTAILTLDKVLNKVDEISENIKQAEIRVEKIDPRRYPEKLGSAEPRKVIENVKEQFNGLTSLFVDAKPLVKKLPEIFGNNKEKTYLLLFQNDKELRATGGFLTAYAVFRVRNGKIKIERSEDIYSLDNTIADHPKAPKEILTYHKNVSLFFIRDSNISPDFPKSVALFNSLYEKSGAKIKYDGIVTLDSKILVDMLNIFGDTEADGIVFSSRVDKRCDCPQVLYRLFDMVDRPTPYLRENRKGILGDLMYALFYKAIGFSPSKYWGTLAQQMFDNLQKKHILLYFVDADLQRSIEKLGFGGTIISYPNDYLHINNVNFAGAKSNMFVSESIVSKTKKESGKIIREVTVQYRNPYPHSDCSLERGGLCLNATLRNWLRVYVPTGSKLISFQGSQKKVQTYDELGKTVFEGYLEVPTQGTAQVIVAYALPEGIDMGNYSLLIQKQPGTDNQKYKVEAEGRTVFNGVLDKDKEIKLK